MLGPVYWRLIAIVTHCRDPAKNDVSARCLESVRNQKHTEEYRYDIKHGYEEANALEEVPGEQHANCAGIRRIHDKEDL